MAFLRPAVFPDGTTILQGRGICLKPPQMADYGAWAELRTLSRAHLTPWEPAWPRDDLSRSAYRRRLRHYMREAREDTGYAFLIFKTEDQALIGGLTLSNIRRGVTQAATLGYWLGLPHARRGYMTAAVRSVLPHVFDGLRLHRVEAAVQPDNIASVRLLEGAGFTREGLAKRYLKINGAWQDHLLYGLVAEDWAAREAHGR